MASDEPTETPSPGPAEDAPPEGVFGNLPRTRPGARSPRRDSTPPTGRDAPVAAASEEPPQPERSDRPRERPQPHAPAAGGIEDVAWAGVAAAAEAATIGVRLATRALEAMRDAVDRR